MPRSDSTALSVFALLSSLRAAVEVRYGMAERRAGRDPSEQEEAASAEQALREALPELRGFVAQLRVSLVVDRREDTEAALVQDFEDRLVLARLARELHIVHQRLLSLYPAVPETLVEEARLRQGEAEGLATASGDGFGAVLVGWLDRAGGLLEGLEKALPAPN